MTQLIWCRLYKENPLDSAQSMPPEMDNSLAEESEPLPNMFIFTSLNDCYKNDSLVHNYYSILAVHACYSRHN